MGEHMVEPAEEDSTLDGRRAAIGPMIEMMDVGPPCGSFAAVPGASAVAGDDCPPLRDGPTLVLRPIRRPPSPDRHDRLT